MGRKRHTAKEIVNKLRQAVFVLGVPAGVRSGLNCERGRGLASPRPRSGVALLVKLSIGLIAAARPEVSCTHGPVFGGPTKTLV